jgi:hypothetical protein
MEQNFAASLNAKKGPGFGEGRKHAVGGHMFGLHHGMMSYNYYINRELPRFFTEF